MKKYIIALLLPAILILVGGCSKDFLTVDDQELLTRGKLDELTKRPSFAAELLTSKLDGVYAALYNRTGGGPSGFDRGLRFVQLQLDYTTCEIVYPGNNWGRWDYLRGLFEPQYARPNQFWNKFYHLLGMINPIINNDLPPEGEEPNVLVAPLYGQLYALRGICYYYLVNLFRKPYLARPGVKDEPCVPLVLQGTEEEISKQATVEEVYQQAIRDLEIGAKYAGGGTPAKTEVNASVAYAYLTKIHLERGEWDKAIASARACFGGNVVPKPFPDAVALEFSKLDPEDMMWGRRVTAETNFGVSSLFSHLDPTANGYSKSFQVRGYNAVVDRLPETDARKEWFSPGFQKGDPALDKFIAKWGGFVNGAANPYVMMKYACHSYVGDYVYLRYSDVYLMLLEAMYEAGQEDELKGLLNKFVTLRDPAYDCSALSGDALRDEIRFQRRIELIGEGVSWFDYRRWRIPIDRNAPGKSGRSNHVAWFPVIEPGSPMLAWPIPRREMQQNPHFNSEPPYIMP